MNELVGESGANCREIEQEKTCKKQEGKKCGSGGPSREEATGVSKETTKTC